MAATVYCLVDPDRKVYQKDGAESYDDIAAAYGLTEPECDEYRFDLTTRRLVVDRATPVSTMVVGVYLDRRVGTPERLMKFAEDGHLSRDVLASLLDVESRRRYLEACAEVERHYTEACTATNDPCLESGCAMDQTAGEICLQPIVRAGIDYHKACAVEWIKMFRSPQKRIDAWKN